MGSHVSLARITGRNYKIQEILMSLFQLGPMMFGGTSGIISFLQSKHLLAAQKQCACGTAMELQDRNDINDGCRWRCPHCNKRITIRDGSFFEKSKLTTSEMVDTNLLVGTAIPCDRCCRRSRGHQSNSNSGTEILLLFSLL